MNELIPIEQRQIGGQLKPTVNARTLHVFLGSQRDYTDWIKYRIKQYEFVEGVDFNLHNFVEVREDGTGSNLPKFGNDELMLHKFVEHRIGNGRKVRRELTEYFLTVNMAKELSMVENTARGKQARRYFIECEELVQRGQIAANRRLQQFMQQRGLPRLDNCQMRAVNQKAFGMGRQISELCRDYLLWELAAKTHNESPFSRGFVDDYELQGTLHYASVDDLLAYSRARELAWTQSRSVALAK